jgi:hypothetical protein
LAAAVVVVAGMQLVVQVERAAALLVVRVQE